MKKILSFFTYHPRPASASGFPLALAETGCIFLLSLLLLSLLPSDRLPADPGLRLLYHQLPLTLICPLAALFFLRIRNAALPLTQILDFRLPPQAKIRKLLFQNFGILFWTIPAILMLNLLTIYFLKILGFQNLPEQRLFTPENIHSWTYCLILFFSTVFLAPLSEELLFRHLIFNCLDRYLPLPLPQLITSGAFSLFHGIPQAIPSLFLLALILQKRKEEDGLEGAILLHGTYNLIAFLAIYLQIRVLSS